MTTTFNTTAIRKAVRGAFGAAKVFGARVDELKDLLAGADRETIEDVVMHETAAYYGTELHTCKTGRIVWKKEDGATKRNANRLIAAIVGASNKSAEDKAPAKVVRFSANQKDAAAVLLAECGGNLKRAIAALKQAAAAAKAAAAKAATE